MEEDYLIDWSIILFNCSYTFRVAWKQYIKFFGTHNYEFDSSYDPYLKRLAKYIHRHCNIGNLGLYFIKRG